MSKVDIDLRTVLHSMVLNKPARELIWTGYPSSKSIKEYVVRDEKARKDVISKLTNLENLIREIRDKTYNGKSDDNTDFLAMTAKIEKLNLELMNLLFEKKSCNVNLFLVVLRRTYEEIKRKCPSEVKDLAKPVKDTLEKINQRINSSDPIVVLEKYDLSTKKSNVIPILTESQENKFVRKNNRERLHKNIAQILDKKNLTKQEEENWVREMCRYIMSADVFSIINERNIAEMIYQSTFINYLIDQGLSREEICNLSEVQGVAVNQFGYNEKPVEVHSNLQADYILKYLEYIDIDKLFLLFATRGIDFFESFVGDLKGVLTSENGESLEVGDISVQDNERREIVSEEYGESRFFQMRESVEAILTKKLIPSSTKINLADYGEHSASEMKAKLKNFCGDIYITPNMIEFLTYMLYQNKREYWEYPDLLNRLNLSKEECYYFTIRGVDNAENLLDNKIISKEFIMNALSTLVEDNVPNFAEYISDKYEWDEEIIEELGKIPYSDPRDMYKELKKRDILKEQDIKDGYDRGTFSIEGLEALQVDETKMFELASEQELMDVYKEYGEAVLKYNHSKTAENEQKLIEAREKKDRKLIFYRRFKLNKLNEQQKTENAEELILNYYSNLDSKDLDEHIIEVLREMYQDRLVNFESIKNTDEEFLKSLLIDVMLKRGQLTLNDTMQLRNILSFEEINDVVVDALKDKNIDENQKFVLVMNIFHRNTEEDNKARKKYLRQFKFITYNSKSKKGGQQTDVDDEELGDNYDGKNDETFGNSNSAYKQHIYPDYIKWLFMQEIDKNAIVKKYANGYVEFYLPKFDKRVIEKYYDVERYTYKIKDIPVYGVATSIISDSKFRANQSRIIKNVKVPNYQTPLEVIDARALGSLVSKKDRVIHYTKSQDKNWMRSLVNHLGINLQEDTRYLPEELQSLNTTISALENLYEER